MKKTATAALLLLPLTACSSGDQPQTSTTVAGAASASSGATQSSGTVEANEPTASTGSSLASGGADLQALSARLPAGKSLAAGTAELKDAGLLNVDQAAAVGRYRLSVVCGRGTVRLAVDEGSRTIKCDGETVGTLEHCSATPPLEYGVRKVSRQAGTVPLAYSITRVGDC